MTDTEELVQRLRALGPGGHTLRATEHYAHGWAHEIAADELERLGKHKDILARALLLAQTTDNSLDVLNDIRDALESRGYFHMANGRDIGALIDELIALRESCTLTSQDSSKQ